MTGDERELRTAWQRHIGTGDTAERWFDTVVAHHREPGRHYHDLRHVRWVVHHTRRLAAEAVSLDEATVDVLVAAACFHDTVYDVHRNDNEAVSAQIARRALDEIGWPDTACARVAALVEATAHLAGDPAVSAPDPARDVLLAADLGVLATEPSRYADYVRAIRREYAHLDDAAWRQGRSAFAAAMLERPHIFPPSLGLDGWERRARANLTAELAALRG